MRHKIRFDSAPHTYRGTRDHVYKDGVLVAFIVQTVKGWYIYGIGFDPRKMYRSLRLAHDAARMMLAKRKDAL